MILEELIAQIARCLDGKKVPYMIIGGQAVLLYGRPRLTRDIDITLGVDSDRFEMIAGVCKDAGLKILPIEPEAFAAQTKILPAEDPDSKMRVDFIFSFTPYEQQALERVRRIDLAGCLVCFASCEDVIIHKMIAARAIDEEDVKSILIKHKESIDFEYIKRWLSEFGKISEHKDVLTRFDRLLRDV
jgi:predicted nucleotidyltransferase